MTTPEGAFRAASYDPFIIRELLALDEGWATGLTIAWTLAGDNSAARRRVRLTLNELARDGVLTRIYINHRDTALDTFRLDRAAITAAMAVAA